MREYPQSGERWKHRQGWTVIVLRLSAAPASVAAVNPEFSHEVLYRYGSDSQITSSPLAWFEESYTRISAAPRTVAAPSGEGSVFNPLSLHPSVKYTRWRDFNTERKSKLEEGHYSKFL